MRVFWDRGSYGSKGTSAPGQSMYLTARGHLWAGWNSRASSGSSPSSRGRIISAFQNHPERPRSGDFCSFSACSPYDSHHLAGGHMDERETRCFSWGIQQSAFPIQERFPQRTLWKRVSRVLALITVLLLLLPLPGSGSFWQPLSPALLCQSVFSAGFSESSRRGSVFDRGVQLPRPSHQRQQRQICKINPGEGDFPDAEL